MNPRLTRYLLLVALLLLMLAQMLAASPAESAAFDESYTITYGYAYLHTGDARLSRGQNPPLTNVLIALPLLLRNDVAFPIDHPTWQSADIYGFSDEFLWKANVDHAAQLVMLARLPEMALALLLACVVYAFARSLLGHTAALFSLFLCAFDPNILAHGHIVGTDLGVTLFMLSAVWLWTLAVKRASVNKPVQHPAQPAAGTWREQNAAESRDAASRKRPGWIYALIAGLLTGAALATKYSAVWLIPIMIALGLIYPGLKPHWPTRVKMLVMLGLAAFVVIWATFAFSIGPIDPGGLPVPAPQYWASLGKVANRVESSTPAFMLGQISPTGFTLYDPFVFLVKTPLPALILLALGVFSLMIRRRREDVVVWLPPLLFILAAMSSNLNLGYRLILPALPFALLIAGQGVSALLRGAIKPRGRKDTKETINKTLWLRPAGRLRTVSVASLLLTWLAFDTLSIGPNHLAYFNQLINREHDYETLVDSNLDWGQGLVALREWQQNNHVDDLHMAYYGTARPEAYGLQAQLLPSFTLNDFGPEVDGFSGYALKPGWYAISATSLQLGTLYSRWKLYEAFKTRAPETRISRSFLMYNVTYPSNEIDRAVVLGPIASDLDQQTLGGRDDRQLSVKWAGNDAAVLDMQGPARYITRGGEPLVGFAPVVREALLAHGAKLGSDASGQLRLWEINARSALSETLKTLENQPISTAAGTALGLPIQFEGGLSLIGYDAQHVGPDQPIELVTYWRADQTPQPPLSIFAHAVDRDGRIIAQRDGLNVRLSSLEPGDVIIQHFTLEQPIGIKAFEIGLYDPSNGQRQLTDQKMDRVELIWK